MTLQVLRWVVAAILTMTVAIGVLAQQPPAQQPPSQQPAAQQKGRGGGGRGGSPVAPLEESGFRPIFDGQSLKGWDCDPDFWRVENGAIAGESKTDHQPPQNIFCIWRDGKPADFELKLEYRLTGASSGNSGFQYRSIERPDVAKWVMQGYQADIDAQQRYTGQIYEERARGFLALRGRLERGSHCRPRKPPHPDLEWPCDEPAHRRR